MRPSRVRAPATDTCWPTTARTTVSHASTVVGTRRPGRSATSGASDGVGGQRRCDGRRLGVEVEPPAYPVDQGRGVAQVGVAAHDDVVSGDLDGDDRGADRQRHRAAVRPAAAGRLVHLEPVDCARGEELPHGVGVVRRTQPQAQHERRIGCGERRRRRAAQLRGREAELAAHDVVELADAREAGRERDVGERQRRLLDQQPRGLRATAHREVQRPGADLGDERAVQVALADVQRAREAGDPAVVDRAVGDEPQRARREVAAVVPVPRAGRRVGTAATAGPEAGADRRRGRGEEADVRRLRRLRRAHRTAVDPGARDAEPDPAVEAPVTRRQGGVGRVDVEARRCRDGPARLGRRRHAEQSASPLARPAGGNRTPRTGEVHVAGPGVPEPAVATGDERVAPEVRGADDGRCHGPRRRFSNVRHRAACPAARIARTAEVICGCMRVLVGS